MTRDSQSDAFQRLFDAANKVLEATYNDEKSARMAIEALERTRALVERRLDDLKRETVRAIDASASTTATQAAALLREKFKDADEVANRAAKRYADAENTLGWKLLGIAMLVQATLLGGLWLLVQRTVPSYTEIEARRVEIQRLETQVTELERRGGGLYLTTCIDRSKRTHLCYRTNETIDDGPYSSQADGKTFRIPWGY
jgi:hypothetical protein